ncbi:hypothetical protein OG235_02465 [Streptomyces sp. NBC_00024]|uniref:hypothetical protein n=1 Tax=Streptomyces sp. NBC_00024 TaxID=2903612 RepID=UPI003244FB67
MTHEGTTDLVDTFDEHLGRCAARLLLDAGLPAPFAALLVDSDLGVSRGELFTASTDLQRLIRRPSKPLTDVVAAAVRTA